MRSGADAGSLQADAVHSEKGRPSHAGDRGDRGELRGGVREPRRGEVPHHPRLQRPADSTRAGPGVDALSDLRGTVSECGHRGCTLAHRGHRGCALKLRDAGVLYPSQARGHCIAGAWPLWHHPRRSMAKWRCGVLLLLLLLLLLFPPWPKRNGLLRRPPWSLKNVFFGHTTLNKTRLAPAMSLVLEPCSSSS